MDRMKTFFIYFLLLVALYGISVVLENGLILDMYYSINGNIKNTQSLSAEVTDAKATNVNGYVNLNIKNNSNQYIDTYYAKLDLINEYGSDAITQYVVIQDLEPGETDSYKVNFRGNKIKEYQVEFISEVPDKTNIINILGWEFDATNIFGLGIDLTNINGVDITQYFSLDGLLNLAGNAWSLGISVAKSIPLWGYVIASLIVVWYL